MRFLLFTSLLLSGVLTAAPAAVRPLPRLEEAVALETALRPERHPRLFVQPADLATGRHNARETAWGRAYLEKQRQVTARFLALSDEALRALVPAPGSLFVYGLGLNLDPYRGQRLRWAGWEDPFAVLDREGRRYPNADWPDQGEGVVDPRTQERHYFIAQANGAIVRQLEQTILPALADVYALSGSAEHARVAAVLLDGIAAVYPTNRRGPLDYPTAPADFDRGGRLDRPYYQTARGLVNYGFAIDLVAASGQLEQPSAYGPFSKREHLVRNLLWDGGTYCHGYAVKGFQLHNGHADYLRGAALVGVLLDVPLLTEPMLQGPLSLPAMLAINIDRNGFYYETSPAYAAHNRELYIDMAELSVSMRALGWPNIPDLYAHPHLRLYLSAPFNRQEVGGHVPLIGDAGPDRDTYSPTRRWPEAPRVTNDAFIESQIEAAWIQLVRSPDEDREPAARLLADSYSLPGPVAPPAHRWTLYHIGPRELAAVQRAVPDRQRLETGSVLYGAKGLALLRGGRGERRFGAQLFFGPSHNHSQREALTWTFFARGTEWSYDPGYFNKHYRMGWTTQTVAHQAVVVNATSHPWDNGSARVLAWQADGPVQWALASHPDLYANEGVTRFERLIAQVEHPVTGELAYWLDVSRVEGGETRDDSFHTQLQRVESDRPWPPAQASRPALFGSRDLGAAILPSLYLEGHDSRNFYFVAPGDGYGFLGSPRERSLEQSTRLAFRDPLFASSQSEVRLVADLLGAPGRRVILADGGAPPGVARVPYIVQRDRGAGASTFAKVLRLVDPEQRDTIARVDAVPIENPGATAAGALLVTWSEGRRDLWIVSDAGGISVSAEAEGLPRVTTDARVAFVQFDGQGRVQAIRSSGASGLTVAGGPRLAAPGVLRGRVTQLGPGARLRVEWSRPDAAAQLVPGTVMVTQPPRGATAAWTLASVEGDLVALEDATLALAETEMRPAPGGAGRFSFAAGISRFYSGGARANTRYALGKAVYQGDTLIGRVVALEEKTQVVTLEGPGVAQVTAPTPVRLLEVATGDAVEVALNHHWSATRD